MKTEKLLEAKIEEFITTVFMTKVNLLGSHNRIHRRFYPFNFVSTDFGTEKEVMSALRNLMHKGRINIFIQISENKQTLFTGDIRDLSLQQINDFENSLTNATHCSNLSFNTWFELTETFIELLLTHTNKC